MSDKVAKARSSSSKSSSSRNSSSSKMADSLVSDAVACIVRDDVDALRKMVATSSIGPQTRVGAAQGQTLLMVAAGSGKRLVVEYFLEEWAKQAKKSDDDVIKLLNMTDEKRKATALHFCCRKTKTAVEERKHDKDRAAIARLLVESGCEINSQDADGATALMLAVGAGDRVLCDSLLAFSEDIDIELGDTVGRTAMDYAAENNDLRTGSMLFQEGLDCPDNDYGEKLCDYIEKHDDKDPSLSEGEDYPDDDPDDDASSSKPSSARSTASSRHGDGKTGTKTAVADSTAESNGKSETIGTAESNKISTTTSSKKNVDTQSQKQKIKQGEGEAQDSEDQSGDEEEETSDDLRFDAPPAKQRQEVVENVKEQEEEEPSTSTSKKSRAADAPKAAEKEQEETTSAPEGFGTGTEEADLSTSKTTPTSSSDSSATTARKRSSRLSLSKQVDPGVSTSTANREEDSASLPAPPAIDEDKNQTSRTSRSRTSVPVLPPGPGERRPSPETASSSAIPSKLSSSSENLPRARVSATALAASASIKASLRTASAASRPSSPSRAGRPSLAGIPEDAEEHTVLTGEAFADVNSVKASLTTGRRSSKSRQSRTSSLKATIKGDRALVPVERTDARTPAIFEEPHQAQRMSRRSSRAGPPPQQLAGSNISGASSTTNGTAQERLDLEQEDTADMQEEGSSMMPRVVSRRSQVRKSTTSSSSTRKSSTAQKEVGPSGLPIMPASTRTDERDEAVLASQESSRASRRSSSGSTSKYPSFSYSVGNVKEIKLVQPRKSEVLEDEEEEDHVLEDEDGRLILDISPSSASSRASRRSGRSFAVVRRSSSSLQDLQDQLRQSKNGVYINDAPRVEDQDYQAEVDASRAGAYQAEVDASSRAVVISPSPREDKQQENTNNMMMNEDSQSKVNIIKAKAEVVSHSQTPRIDPAMDPELLADSRSLTLVPGAKSVQQAFSTLAHGGAEFFDIHTPGEDDNTTTVAAWKPNMNPRPRRRRRIKAQKPHKTMEEKAQAESLREVHTETIAWFRHVRDELLRRLSSTHKVRRSLQEQNLLHLFTAKEYERRHELGLQSTSAEQIGMNDAEEEETSGGVAIPENEMRSDIKNDTASGPNVGEVDVVVDKMNDSEAAAKSTSGNYKDITAEVIIEDNRRETKVDTTLVENVKTASESTSSSTYSTSTKDKEKRVSFKQGPEISKNDTTPPQHQTTTKPQKTSSDRAPATHSPYQHEFYVYTAVESVLVAEALSPDVENLVDEELAGVEGTDEATKAIQREVVLAEIREGKLRFVYDYLQDVLTREERRLVWKAGLRNLSLDQLLDLVLIARTEQLLGSGEMHFDFRRFVRETEPILEVDKRIVERIADVGEVLRNGAETERNKNEEQTSTSFPEQQDQRVRRLPRVEGESSALVGGYHQAEYGEDGFSHEHANHRSALERHWHSTSKGFEASLGIAKYYARGGGGGLLAAPSGGHGGAAGGAVDLGRSADYNSGNPLPEGGGAAKDGEDEVKGRDCSRVEGDDGNYNNNVDGAGGSYQYYPDVDDSTDHDVALEVPSSGLFHYEDFEKTRASERQKDHERVFSFFVEESASSSKKPNVVGQEDQAQEKRRSSRPGVNITPVAERASRSRSSANYSTRTPSDHVVALESPAAPVSVIATSTGSFGRRRSRVSEQNKFMQDQNQKETRRSNEEVSSSRGSDVGTSTRRSSAPSAKNMMMLKQNHELLSTLPENVRRSKHLSSGGSGQGQEGETNMTTEVLEPHITAGQRRSSILRAASSNGTGGGGRGGAVGTSSSNSTSSIMGLRIKSSSSEPRIVEDVTSTNSSKNTNAPHQSPPQGPPGASKPISISTTPSAAATSILTGVPSSSPSASTASSLMRTKSQERWAQLQAKHRSRMFHELAQELRNNHLKDQQEQASAGNGTSTPSSSSTLAKLHIEASRILREAEEMKKYRRSAMETREARTSGVLAALRLQEELQMKEIDDQDEASSSSADTETVMSGVNEDLQETASSTYVVDRKSAIREAVNAEIAARANLVVVDVVAKNASEKIGVSKSGELPGNDVFVKRVVSNVATNSKNYVGVGGEGAPSSRGGTPTTLSSANSSHSRSSTSTTTSVAVAPVTSMAASMGIRIGDRILSVNRTSTERMTQDHFAVALAQRPVCVSFGRRGMLTYDLVTPPVDIVTGLSPWENLRIELEVTLVASESPGSSFSFSPSASVDAPVVVRQLQQAVISSPSEITGSGQSLSSSTFNTALEQQAKQSKPSKTAGIGLSKIGKLPGTALVKRVVPGSAAEEAGIEAGDRIVSMNGMLLNNRKMTEERFRTMVLSERPLKILVATRVVVDNNTKMLNTLFDRRSCATTTSSASKASIDRSALLDEDDDEEVDGIEKGSRTRIVEEVFDVKIDPTTAEDHEDIHIGITKRGDFPGVSLVSRVLPYSIAQMVGVRRGDRIVAVNKVEAAPASSEMWKMTAYGETSGTSGLGVALPSSAVSTPRSTASTRLSRRSSKTSRSKKKLLTEDLYRSMMDMLPLSMRFARFSDVNRENLTFEIVVPSQSSSDEAEINKIGLQKRGTLPGAVTITRVFGYAEQQGVRIGDRLVSINGISTMDMTQEKFEEEMLRRTQAIVPEGREADRDGLTRTSSRTNNNVPAFLASRTSSLNSVSSSRTARTINRTSTTASSRTPPLMLRFARAVPANIVAAAAETSRPQRKNSSVQQVVASSTTLTSSSNSKTPSTSTATTQIIVRCDRDDEKLGIKKLGDLTGGTVAVVRCMTDTGFARLAGVEDGDYIVAVNGESITTFNEDRFQQLILERPLEVSFVRPQGSTVMAVGKTASLLHLEEPDY